mgnify:CR=1 FL=1
MIRVLHVIDHLGLGGAQSALLDMVVNRDAAAVEAEVAVMHGRGMFADALEKAGIKVHVLADSKWPPVYLPSLVRLARSGRYDVLHFHLQGSNWLGKPLCAAVCRAPRVAHDHSSADLRFRGWWSLLPDGLSHLCSDRVVAVSGGVADFLAKHEAVPRRKICVVPNGVDTAVFGPVSAEVRARARASLGLATGDFVAGAFGRLAPEKNFQAVGVMARLCPGIQFIIGGGGPEEASLRRAMAGHGNCRLAGEITDRAGFYAALDVFVLPSLHEALPMTVLEAMASGVPVVASNLEGVAAALGDSGILVAPGKPAEMAAILRGLQEDPGRRAALAAGARRRVEAGFSASGTAARIESIYRELCQS